LNAKLKNVDNAGLEYQPDRVIPVNDTHVEQALDEALLETFPASDPIAVCVAEPHEKIRQFLSR